MNNDNLIEFNNVSFAYTDAQATLKNINLQIPKGKITAIMGGSGSGKTTILRLISAQIMPHQGQIKLFEQNLTTLKRQQIYQLRHRLGMLFQFGALFTDLTVADNIAFPLRENTCLSESLISKIVAMKLEAVGLTGTQELFPAQLSGGMSRRVALARAIALDPEIMLYDEPFTGLDPISLNSIAMLIKKLNNSLHQTAVLVTHDIPATMQIADYLYFMANGEVIAHGTPQIMQNSLDPRVKQFLRGEIHGDFEFKYPSKRSYHNYLGL